MDRYGGWRWRSGACCVATRSPGSAVRRASIPFPNILTREFHSMTGNNKNMILAIALSALVIFAWQFFVVGPQMKAEQAKQAAIAKQEKAHPHAAAPASPAATPSVPGMVHATSHMSRQAALKAGGARVTIDSPLL